MVTIIAILFISFLVWLLFEAWRAPGYRQDIDGNYHQVTPSKKFKDLFKRKK